MKILDCNVTSLILLKVILLLLKIRLNIHFKDCLCTRIRKAITYIMSKMFFLVDPVLLTPINILGSKINNMG